MYHTKAWSVWLVAALLPFMLTRNPLYLGAALGAMIVDFVVVARPRATSHPWGTLVKLGLSLALFGILLNALLVSVGATKLFTLPALRLTFSRATIQIGGAVTLESVVYGTLQAAALTGILLAFATFNACADHYELLRAAPRFLYQSAIVLSIALTFVPHMMTAQAEIREAQMLRGHRFRAIRDWAPLFIALLASGLEHSITLAESMSARGFGGSSPRVGRETSSQHARRYHLAIAGGLLLLLCGALAWSMSPIKWIGAMAFVGGVMLLVLTVWRLGARVRVSRYRRRLWLPQDRALLVVSLAVIGVWVVTWLGAPATLGYYPYPRLKPPGSEPWLLVPTLLLAMPALLARWRAIGEWLELCRSARVIR